MPDSSNIHIRSLTVHKYYHSRRYDEIIIPHIRLCGKWLEQAGFKCGDNVNIIVSRNLIIIRKGE